MVRHAIDMEAQDFLNARATRVDGQGRRYVIRNGYLPGRQFLIAAVPIEIRQPQRRDKSPNTEDRVVLTPQRPGTSEAAMSWTSLSGDIR